MSYNRSPDRMGFKRKRPTASELVDERGPSIRSGNMSSPQDRRSSSDYRDPPRDGFRFTSDKGGRSWESRDRSRSPRRNRQPSGRRDERDPDGHVPAAWNVYRPTYDPSPRVSPARPELIAESRDSRASAISSPHPNPTDKTSSPVPNQPNKKTDSIIAPIVSSPHPKPSDNMDPIAVPKTITQTAEPANETMVSQQTLESHADAVKDFSDLLYAVIEAATDLAALKTQKGAAEREFSRKEAEYNRTKPNHEKFPATEEGLKRIKESAKMTLVTIGEKCQKKDAVLKNMVIQGASRLLPRLGPTDQGLKAQVDSLAKRCQDLENQLESQKLFINDQRLAREDLETKYQTFQNELATTNNNYEQFSSYIRPRVDEALLHSSKYMNELQSLQQATSIAKRDLADLAAEMPKNLELRLGSISTRLDNLKNLNHSKAKEESISTATSKALADSSKTLEDYGQKLQSLDILVRGDGIKLGLAGHISTLADDQSAHRKELSKAYPNWAFVAERVTATETHAARLDTVEKKFANIPSNVDLIDLRKRISVVESQSNSSLVKLTEVDTEVSDSKKRLTAVEKQSRSSTPAAEKKSSPEAEHLTSLEKRVSVVEKARSSPNTPIPAVASPTPAIDLEALTKEFLEVVRDMQSASDEVMGGDIDKLKATIADIQMEMDNRNTNFYVPFSAIPAKLDALSKTVTQNDLNHANYLQQIDGKFNNWTVSQQNAQQILDNRIDGVEMGIVGVDKRMSLMNTKEMAIYILNQMDSTYPNLRDAQNALAAHTTSLQRAETRFLVMDNTTKALQLNIQTLEGLIQQNPAGTEKGIIDLRQQVAGLNGQLMAVNRVADEAKVAVETLSTVLSEGFATSTRVANEAKEAVDELTKAVGEQVTNSNRVAEEAKETANKMSKTSEETTNYFIDKIGNVDDDIRELKEKHSALETRISSVKGPRAIMPPTVDSSFGSGSVMNIRGRAKQSSEARQASGEPLAKKRFPNGQPPTGPRKTNGIYSSPGRKRKKPVIDGDSDDSSFEPAQPAISEDEDD